MFIPILNLTRQHLNIAVGSELAGWDCGLGRLPSSPCGSGAGLCRPWEGAQALSSPSGSRVGSVYKNQSKVSTKISDLRLVQVLFLGVLPFPVVWGVLEGFCQGPGRGQKAHSAGVWERSCEGTSFRRCRLAERTKRF